MKKLVFGFTAFAFIAVLAYGLSFAKVDKDGNLVIKDAGKIEKWKSFHMKHGSQKEFKAKVKDYKAPGCKSEYCHEAMPANAKNAPKDIIKSCTNETCHNSAKLKTNIEGLKKKK